MTTQPALLVTIDVEPDDQWTRSPVYTVENTRMIPRLQGMFDRHGVRPTYFVSYLVASDPGSVEILRKITQEGKCEIGSHLHAWDTPPEHEIEPPLWSCPAYLYQYPKDIQRRKFEVTHRKLTEQFGFEPTSYRAGRYGLDPHGVTLLKDFRYLVDSSVTPMLTWQDDAVAGTSGPDFRRAPVGAYELSETDVCVPGESGVLEVPVSVGYTRRLPAFFLEWLKLRAPQDLLVRGLGKALGLRKRWYRPSAGVPVRQVRPAAEWLLEKGVGFLNMMFHSSELIPNSKWCKNESEVEEFFSRVEKMVVMAQELGCQAGTTLSEFASYWKHRRDAQTGNASL